MSMTTVVLYALFLLVASCTPSPRYVVGRKSGTGIPSESPRETTPQIRPSETTQEKKPTPGKKFRGIASYYADDFHNKKTANGETYDMNGLTAAHQTLPFNTWIEVTNLTNGRTVIVRVNDRGPFVGDRIIDLSYGAAIELHMIEAGIQEVEIEVLR